MVRCLYQTTNFKNPVQWYAISILETLAASQRELNDCPSVCGFMTAYDIYVLENSMVLDKNKLIHNKIDP